MAAVTLGVNTQSSSNVDTYQSASFTPAAGDLLVAFITATATVATPGFSDSQNLNWTQVAAVTKATGADCAFMYVANTLAANSAMTVTFTCIGDNASGCGILVYRISGMTKTGSAAIRQVKSDSNQSSANTPAVTAFDSACLTDNPTVGMAACGTVIPTFTTPLGWTQIEDGFTVPTCTMGYISRDSGFTGTAITWQDYSGSSQFCDIIAELDTSAAATTTVPPIKLFTLMGIGV